MRKGVAIGLLAITTIGTVIFFTSQPRKGSVAWHKKEYLAAVKTLFRIRSTDRLRKRMGLPKESIDATQSRRLKFGLTEHQRTLLESGYLIERRFVISNRPVSVVHGEMAAIWLALLKSGHELFTWLHTNTAANAVSVIGRAEDLPFWEDAIRRSDQPESRK